MHEQKNTEKNRTKQRTYRKKMMKKKEEKGIHNGNKISWNCTSRDTQIWANKLNYSLKSIKLIKGN